jgi:DNA-binding NarL/FixJ family response regulator
MMSAATVLLVEDHPIYREGLRRVLESQDALTIVGETDTVRGALEQARAQRPDLILLDLGLKDGSGLDALPRLLPALRAGARGFVSKDTASSQILKAIHAVLSGELWAERRMTAQLVDELFRQKQERQAVETLTPRERQVLRLVGEGKRNAEIAGALFISEHTVKTHMSSLMHKLKIEGRSRLALYAARCDAGLH